MWFINKHYSFFDCEANKWPIYSKTIQYDDFSSSWCNQLIPRISLSSRIEYETSNSLWIYPFRLLQMSNIIIAETLDKHKDAGAMTNWVAKRRHLFRGIHLIIFPITFLSLQCFSFLMEFATAMSRSNLLGSNFNVLAAVNTNSMQFHFWICKGKCAPRMVYRIFCHYHYNRI